LWENSGEFEFMVEILVESRGTGIIVGPKSTRFLKKEIAAN